MRLLGCSWRSLSMSDWGRGRCSVLCPWAGCFQTPLQCLLEDEQHEFGVEHSHGLFPSVPEDLFA